MKVSVAGLGIIGAAWTEHLEKDGVLGASWNRTPKDLPRYTEKLESLPELSEVIHLVVADPPAVKQVLSRLLPGLSEKHLVIQSSTIDPASSAEFLKLVSDKGARYLEAPFTGSLPAAEKRKMVFYLGGHGEVVEEAPPYLERLSKKIFHIGNNQQACLLKLAMNLQIASAVEALSEALSSARKAGIPDKVFFEAFRVNASYSGVAALKEEKLKASDFSPQFSVKHMGKDLRLLQKTCHEELPVLNRLVELFDLAEKQGMAEEDFSALIKLR